MNIEEMIWNGASEEEVEKALAEIREEKARQEAALRAAQEAQAKAEQNSANEALKAEGRAYLINALLCYGQAFGLLTPEDMDEEEIAELEQMIMRVEKMAPMYIKLYDMQNKFDAEFFKGLM